MDRRLDRKFHTAQLFAIAFLFAGAMNWSCALGECKLLLLANLPVTVSNNRPLIDGEINGHKIRILVDTGSAYTTIWRSEAVRLGFPLEDVRDSGATHSVVSPGAVAHAGIRGEDAEVQETHTGAGIGRRELKFTVAKFDSITIGDEKVQNLRLQVTELAQNMRVGATGSRVSAPVQGAPHMLIGADFFLSHRIIIPPNGPAIPFTYAGGPVFQAMHNVAPEAEDSTSTDIQSTGAAAKPEGGAR